MNNISTDILIIGAGISGLSLSYYLQQKGVDSIIIEKSHRAGGWINSEKIDQSIVECGPHTLIYNENVKNLIESLGLKPITVDPKEHARFIVNSKGEQVQLPNSPISALKSPLIKNSAIAKGLLSLIFPWHIKKEDISVGEFFSSKLGDHFVQNILDPALSGIWACDVNKLSLRSAMPSLWSSFSKKESLRKRPKKKYKGFVSFDGGLEELVTKLSQHSNILYEQNIEHLEISDKIYLRTKSHEITANKIYICTSLNGTVDILNLLNTEQANSLSNLLGKIPLSSIGLSHYLVNDSAKAQGFGFLVPSKHKLNILGCIFSSNIFHTRAPKGYKLLSCFSGGAHRPDLAHASTRQEDIKKDLAKIINVSPSDLKLLKTIDATDAIPNYALGHYKIEDEITRFEKSYQNKISLLGTYREGISLGSRIDNAHQIAKKFTD